MVYATTEIGEITDYLKANPYLSREEVMWGMSVPYLKISTYDTTHVVYLSEKQAKEYKQEQRKANAKKKSAGITDDPEEFARALGIPSF